MHKNYFKRLPRVFNSVLSAKISIQKRDNVKIDMPNVCMESKQTNPGKVTLLVDTGPSISLLDQQLVSQPEYINRNKSIAVQKISGKPIRTLETYEV